MRDSIVEWNDFLFRTHGIHRNPLSSGNPGLNRFDAPDGSYVVLYFGRDPFCAFIESFAHVTGTRAVTTTALKARAIVKVKPARPILLVDLTESGSLLKIGADARLFAAEYNTSQLWSKALHDHPAQPHGLLYPSRLDPLRQSVALFRDRKWKMVELSRQSWYAHGAQRILLAEIVEHYGIQLIENQYATSRKPVASVRQEGLFEN
jgi:RES domain